MCNLERVVLSMDTTLMLSQITLGFIPRSSLRTLGSFVSWGHNLRPGHKDSLVRTSPASWSGTEIMHWLSTVPLQVHGAFPRWKGFGQQLPSYSWQLERPMREMMGAWAHVDPRGQKGWKMGCNYAFFSRRDWIPHLTIFLCSSNKTRGIRSSMKCFSLLLIITNTVLVNKYQPYSKLNPVLFLRHFEK